jgi:hypothetical protein
LETSQLTPRNLWADRVDDDEDSLPSPLANPAPPRLQISSSLSAATHLSENAVAETADIQCMVRDVSDGLAVAAEKSVAAMPVRSPAAEGTSSPSTPPCSTPLYNTVDRNYHNRPS